MMSEPIAVCTSIDAVSGESSWPAVVVEAAEARARAR